MTEFIVFSAVLVLATSLLAGRELGIYLKFHKTIKIYNLANHKRDQIIDEFRQFIINKNGKWVTRIINHGQCQNEVKQLIDFIVDNQKIKARWIKDLPKTSNGTLCELWQFRFEPKTCLDIAEQHTKWL